MTRFELDWLPAEPRPKISSVSLRRSESESGSCKTCQTVKSIKFVSRSRTETALQRTVGSHISNGVIKMDYLFVVIALASLGLVFAGLKGSGGNQKKITRLEL